MKFIITFKTPDALFYAIEDIPPEVREECYEAARRFIKYDELVRIEFSTEDNTATVLPQ